MQKIPKQEYTAEFKEQAIKRVKDGRSVAAVAKEMGLVEQTLRNWVKGAESGWLNGVSPQQAMELSRLRSENARLKREVEILKKRRRISRGRHCDVRLDQGPSRPVCAQ